MTTTKHALSLYGLLIALAGAGWYAGTHYQKPVQTIKQLNAPDTIVTNLTIHRYNQQGILVNIITSPKMQHMPDDNFYHFTQPHGMVVEPNRPRVTFAAKKAIVLNAGEQIKLIGKVIVQQEKTLQMQQSIFRTEELHYFPKKKFIHTDAAVELQQPNGKIQATGMNLYLTEKRLQLLANAHAIYFPDKV